MGQPWEPAVDELAQPCRHVRGGHHVREEPGNLTREAIRGSSGVIRGHHVREEPGNLTREAIRGSSEVIRGHHVREEHGHLLSQRAHLRRRRLGRLLRVRVAREQR